MLLSYFNWACECVHIDRHTDIQRCGYGCRHSHADTRVFGCVKETLHIALLWRVSGMSCCSLDVDLPQRLLCWRLGPHHGALEVVETRREGPSGPWVSGWGAPPRGFVGQSLEFLATRREDFLHHPLPQ